MNLPGNAIKFTDRGEVAMELSGRRLPGPGEERVELRIEVRDTGIGIPPEQCDRVFGKFAQVDSSSTRQHEGTGLGLAVSRGLVELMGGTIGVESAPGRGSVFHVTLALPVESPAAAVGEAPVEIAGLRALVVDDNETNRVILQELLAAWRIEEQSASTGREALRKLETAAAQGRPYDLVILDHHMPGMSGEEVFRRIQASPAVADSVVVVLSSMDFAAEVFRAGEARPDAILTKPVLASGLFDAIASAFGRRMAGLRTAGAAQPAGPRREAAPAGEAPPAVMVVEDNGVNQLVACQMLLNEGLAAVVAENGAEAVRLFTALRPRLVPMDVSMPVMNGFEATARLRAAEAEAGWPPRPHRRPDRACHAGRHAALPRCGDGRIPRQAGRPGAPARGAPALGSRSRRRRGVGARGRGRRSCAPVCPARGGPTAGRGCLRRPRWPKALGATAGSRPPGRGSRHALSRSLSEALFDPGARAGRCPARHPRRRNRAVVRARGVAMGRAGGDRLAPVSRRGRSTRCAGTACRPVVPARTNRYIQLREVGAGERLANPVRSGRKQP